MGKYTIVNFSRKQITAQVLRKSAPADGSAAWRFYTCEVLDDANLALRKNFSLKIFSKDVSAFNDVDAGDIITFSRAKRIPEGRRSSGSYNRRAVDLDVELHFIHYSVLHSVQHPTNVIQTTFNLLTSGMNVTIIGVSLYDAQMIDGFNVLSVLDINETLIEVKYKFNLVVHEHDKIMMRGLTSSEEGTIVLTAEAGRVLLAEEELLNIDELNI